MQARFVVKFDKQDRIVSDDGGRGRKGTCGLRGDVDQEWA